MAHDLIPVQPEPSIPEDWNYDQSVARSRNLFKQVREIGGAALTELLTAHKLLTEDSKKKVGRKWPDKTFTGYCNDIGISDETAYNWLRKYFPAYMSRIGISKKLDIPDKKQPAELKPLLNKVDKFIQFLDTVDNLFDEDNLALTPSVVTLDLIDKVAELWDAVERLLKRVLKEASRIKYRLDMYQYEIEELEKLDGQIESLRESLTSHPAYEYRKLVLFGKNAGKLMGDKSCMKKYKQYYDQIAKELGYEEGMVPTIGHSPTYDMMPEERFKYDLMQIDNLAMELKSLQYNYSCDKAELKAHVLIKLTRQDFELDDEQEPAETFYYEELTPATLVQ